MSSTDQNKIELGTVLQRLYDSEINFEIDSFWDAGFDCKLGSRRSMSVVAEDTFWSTEKAALWLHEQVLIHYPNSDYAMKYGGS